MPTFLPRLDIDLAQYPGGVGIWGALQAIYDTTTLPPEHGVHVHARRVPQRRKEIDTSYGEVHIHLGSGSATITEAAATPYVAGVVLGVALEDISCPYCSAVHLDTARHAAHPHQRHLCERCNQEFLQPDRSVGNPIAGLKRQLGNIAPSRPPKLGSPTPLRINQSHPNFGGGILIWASNPAILWTANKDEAEGIHVHAFEAGNPEPIVDETYQAVEIDGLRIDASMVRVFMIQQSLPHLLPVVQALNCPRCGAEHFDGAVPFAVEPHRNHPCIKCGFLIVTSEPLVSNPLLTVLAKLYANANSAGLTKNPLAP